MNEVNQVNLGAMINKTKYFTVDLEDWFHILDFEPTKFPTDWEKFDSRVDVGLDKILRVLNDSKVKCTFFVLAWLAEKRPELVKYLYNSGHRIASHGYAHQLAYEQSPSEFYDDLLKSKGILEEIISDEVTAYRAPGFSIRKENKEFLYLVYKAGYKIDSSLFPFYRSHGGISLSSSQPFVIELNEKCHLTEYPISTHRIFNLDIIISGGGYFRIAPLSMLQTSFKQNKYLMTYFHPRDFDEDQPMLEGLSLARKIKSYAGLKTSYRKLANLQYQGRWGLLGDDISFTGKNTVRLDDL